MQPILFEDVPSAGTPTATAETSPTPSEAPAEDILSQIQKAGNAALESDNSSKPAPESGTPEAASSDQPQKPAGDESAPEARPAETKPAEPQKSPEEVAESIRQLIKRSNMPPELKDEIADLAYQAKSLREMGFTFDQARSLKQMGISPDSVVERVKLHSTIEDAKMDAELASDMRQFMNDYVTNPSVAAQRLYKTNAETFQPFAREIIRNAHAIDPDLYIEQQSSGFKTALSRLAEQAKATEDADTETAVQIILEKVYGPQAPAGTAPRPDDSPVAQELARLKAERAREQAQRNQELQTMRGQFREDLRNEAFKAIGMEIDNYVNAQAPAGSPSEVRDTMKSQVYQSVLQTLASNPNFMQDAQRLANGPMTAEAFRSAIQYVVERAKPHIPINFKPAVEKWGRFTLADQARKEATQQRAAAKPDVGRPAGPATTAAAPDVVSQVLQEGREKGWDPLQIIREHQRRSGVA